MKYTAKLTQTLVFSTRSCPCVSQMAFLYSCTCNFIVGQAKLYPHTAKPLITLGFQWNRWEWGALDLFQLNIARDFVALAKLWGGHTPQQQQITTTKPNRYPTKLSWSWGNAMHVPLGQPEPLPSCLEIPRKKTRSVLTSSQGALAQPLCQEAGCCKTPSSGWGAPSSWVGGESNGVLTGEDVPLAKLSCFLNLYILQGEGIFHRK